MTSGYIAANSNDPDTADAFLDEIQHKLEILSRQPLIGRQRDELKSGLRSHPVGRYLIFYFPIQNGIDVVRVIYGGRDLNSIDF